MCNDSASRVPIQILCGFLVLGGMHSKGWVLDGPVLIRITPSYFLDRVNLRIWAEISIHESTNGRTEPCRMEGEQTSPILLQARGRGVNPWTPPVLECRSGEGLLHNGQGAKSFASLLWGLEKARFLYRKQHAVNEYHFALLYSFCSLKHNPVQPMRIHQVSTGGILSGIWSI